MLYKLPLKANDWVAVWRATLVMTLPTADSNVITIDLKSIEPSIVTDVGEVIAVKVTVEGGYFYIGFEESIPELEDCLVLYIASRDPKEGRWSIPKWYHDQKTQRKADRKLDEH